MSCVELCDYRLNTSTQSCFSLIINFKLLKHFCFVSCNVVTQKEKIKKRKMKSKLLLINLKYCKQQRLLAVSNNPSLYPTHQS